MYAVRDIRVIVENVTSKRLILLLILKLISKQSDLLRLVKLARPKSLHLQRLR
jgi:hypothetical protein